MKWPQWVCYSWPLDKSRPWRVWPCLWMLWCTHGCSSWHCQLYPSQQAIDRRLSCLPQNFSLVRECEEWRGPLKVSLQISPLELDLWELTIPWGLYWYHAVSQIIPDGSQVPTISISLVLPYFATSILRSAQVNRVESNVVCCIIGKPSLG